MGASCASVPPRHLGERHRGVVGGQNCYTSVRAVGVIEMNVCVNWHHGTVRQGCGIWTTFYVCDPQMGILKASSSYLKEEEKTS